MSLFLGSAGVNPNGRGLAEALLDLDLHLLNTGLQNVQATLTLALILPSVAVISKAG